MASDSKKKFVGLVTGATIYQIALSVQSSIASPFFNDRGISAEEIGLLNSINWGIISFASMPSGRLSDIVGRVGPFVLSSILGSIACILVYFRADFLSALMLYLLVGLSTALFTPNASAFISDIFEAERVTVLFAAFYLLTLAGAAIGSILSGVSSQSLGPEYPFLVASALFVLSAIVYPLLIRREIRRRAQRHDFHTIASTFDIRAMISTIRRNPGLRLYGFSLFFHSLGFLMIGPYVSLYCQKVVGLDIAGVGLVIAAWNFGLAIGSLPWAWASSRRGSGYVLLGHFILSSLSWLVFTSARDMISAVAFGLILGLVGAMDLPARRTITIGFAQNGRLGETMGFIELVNGMGGLFGGVIGGILWERLGPALPFYAAAILTLISVPLALIAMSGKYNRSARQVQF